MNDRFTFRLSRLLALREKAQDRAAVALAQALDAAARLGTELAHAEAVAWAARQRQCLPDGDALPGGERAAVQWLGDCADGRAAALAAEHAVAADDADRRRHELSLRTRERRALEKLRERQADTWRDDHARRARQQMDDVALRISTDRLKDDHP